MDLLVPHRDGGQSCVYLNDGDGAFETRGEFGPSDATIRSVRIADFDVDGVLDPAVVDERAGPYDVDANGRADAIIGCVGSRPVVYFNDVGTGFVPVPFGGAAGDAYGFAVGDLDEDGLLDIAMARSNAPNMPFFGASVPLGE